MGYMWGWVTGRLCGADHFPLKRAETIKKQQEMKAGDPECELGWFYWLKYRAGESLAGVQ